MKQRIEKTKPEAPVDLWERLDAEVQRIAPLVPKNAFSFSDFKKRYGLSDGQATSRLKKLIRDGIVKRVCTGHYAFVNAAEKET